MDPSPVLIDELFVVIPPFDRRFSTPVELIPFSPTVMPLVVIRPSPVLIEEFVVIPPTDPNVSIPVELIPRVTPTTMAAAVSVPLPMSMDEPFVWIPFADPSCRVPDEVIPVVVPNKTCTGVIELATSESVVMDPVVMPPVVTRLPFPRWIEELLVVIPPTEDNSRRLVDEIP